MSDTSVPSSNAQNTEIHPGTVGRKRKTSTAGTSGKEKSTPADHAVHMDHNGDGKQDCCYFFMFDQDNTD